KWQVMADVSGECIIQRPSFLFEDPGRNLHSGLSQAGKSTSADCGIWISRTRHHAFNSCRDQCICAWSGAAMMAAGFKIDVEGCAASFLAGLFQSQNFGMLLPVVSMEALAENFAAGVDQHGP